MSLMDVARGAYVRSPAALRRSLAPLLSLVPTSLKYGGGYNRWRERIALSAADPEFAHTQHLKALRDLLAKAHGGSPFYRGIIERAFGPGFDPATIELDDLRRLPVLRKADLVKAGDAAHAVPRTLMDEGDTSGSNGERPFAFYLDKGRSPKEFAFVNHVWCRTGYREGDTRAVLRGFGLQALGGRLYEWEPALRELRLSVFPLTLADAVRYLNLIDQYEVRYLYGYPSSIDVLCRHLLKLQRRPKLQFKAVLPISEPLHLHQRQTIAAALGDVAIANFYGLSERAIFAAELPGEVGVYEFEPLYGRAELVDEHGEQITEIGKEGRLIGTGFLSTGMPFIRYDTEDRARLVRLPTAENGQRLRVEAITPRRKPDYLISVDGNRVVTIDFTPDNPRFFVGIDEYQFYQEEPGKCTIKYIASPGGTPEDAERVRADLQHRAQDKIAFSLQKVDSLIAGSSGKRAFIDQRLDLSRY
jgi:phenylacetate-CoA ligase